MPVEQVLVTCNEGSEGVALAELRRALPSLPPPDWLETGDAVEGGIMLVRPEMSFEAFAALAEKAVFIRHLAPVQLELALTNSEADIALLTECAGQLAGRLALDRDFAVQTRILGEGKLPYRKVVVNETLSQFLESATGITMDCREPGQVVSVLCTQEKGYLGVSRVELNRSAWAGGKHRFKHEEGQVSRAEFKLLEACSVFGLTLPRGGKALDMGASPGGWSRVLAQAGLHVTAVDPADLDPRLRHTPGIEHVRSRIQDYLPRAGQFDVIVNDIKMDARASVSIMLGASRHLAPGGLGVMTLKMPQMPPSAKNSGKLLRMVREDVDRLRAGYVVAGARQLYHNRNEITVILRGKETRES